MGVWVVHLWQYHVGASIGIENFPKIWNKCFVSCDTLFHTWILMLLVPVVVVGKVVEWQRSIVCPLTTSEMIATNISEIVWTMLKTIASIQTIIRLDCSSNFSLFSGLSRLDESVSLRGRNGSKMRPSNAPHHPHHQQPQQDSATGGPTSYHAPLPSTEDLHSRCGSRQSLLDSKSHKSHLSVATHNQYSNAGCTASTVGAQAGSSPPMHPSESLWLHSRLFLLST